MIDVNLTVDDGAEARLQVEDGQEIALAIDSSYSSRLPDYTGPTSVTPSTSAQELATAETSVHSNITVESIPPEYVVPTGTYAVSSSGTHDVKAYASASVPAGSAAVENQSFTANPTIQVTSGGKITATVSGTKLVAPTVSAGWVDSGGTGTVSVGGTNTRQLTTQAGTTITPSTSQQTAVAASRFTTGAVIVDAMPVGTEGTPTASKGAVSNHTVDVTPSVTNSAGYISGGTYAGTAVSVSASELVSGTYTVDSSGTKDVTNYASASVPAGVEGTPVASKGAVSNHSVSVTPSVTNSGGWVAGGTHSGTAVTVSASELVSGTKSIAANGTGIDVTDYASVDVAVPIPTPSMQTKSKSYTPTESAQAETVSADVGYDGLSSVDVSVAAVSSTYVGSGITRRDSTDLTASGATVTAPAGYYANAATKTIGSGSATASATKGTVSNHSVDVTPKVTRSAGYITSGSANGTAVTVTASELVSGSETKTSNGTYDVTNLAELVVNVSGGGGSVQFDTKTTTASNYPVSLQFTSMKGQPKAFVVRMNAQVASSGSTTYYYIVDIAAFGTTTHGNCFRIGSTRRVDNITSGYSWSYTGTTLTITSSAASRSASPGAFYSGSYELLYAY